ncbi:MAG: type II toxin-antitoxin system VapC family toxin [Synoicihabitans sp.]
MRFLIDSHIVVWWCLFPERLRESTRQLLIDPQNEILLSSASIWELGIKIQKGHLLLPADYAEKLLEDGMSSLHISFEHARLAAALPSIHSDPFDRLLVAQAITEGVSLMTVDRHIRRYDVPTIDP